MRLFCDCKTDEEKSNFFLSGRAVETGVVAPAISNDVAMAYHRCAEFQKELNALRADKAILQQMTYSLKDRLEMAEKERDALRSLVVMRFDHDHPPQFTQGYEPHELNEPVTAEHCRWFVAEIERLRAKIAEMERQEPTRDWWDCLISDISAIDCMYRGSPTYAHDAYWMRDHVVWMLKKRRDALPGAKGEEK